MKIAIVVHGRFHAFDLARELLRRGHQVVLFTNYPKWAVKRFGISGEYVQSCWFHGLLSRLNEWLSRKVSCPYFEAALHTLFGRWAAREVQKERWDTVHCWSGASEEVLRMLAGRGTWRLLVRESTHIRTQARILEEEEKRTAARVEKPSRWMIAREEREYALADGIRVLSRFAYESFVTEGLSLEKLYLVPSGTSVEAFRPSRKIVSDRCNRILAGEPLRVLYVGAVSFRKGMWDAPAIVQELAGKRFRFRFVGAISAEVRKWLPQFFQKAEFISPRPQHELPEEYACADLFIFPTVEDGFGLVLAQAQASALPILATTNCAGPDLIREGKNGWVLPIRSPQAFIERLRWCDDHRPELAAMVRRIYEEYQPRDWAEVAADFEALCQEYLKGRKGPLP